MTPLPTCWTAIARRAIAVAAILATATIAIPSYAYVAGGGKDATKGNDCLIGYEGIDSDDVTLDGKKQVVRCTDCDPTCDLDGVAAADGSCLFLVGTCINQPEVAGCTPPAGLSKAKASAKVSGTKGTIEIDVPQLLEGSVCGDPLDLVVSLEKNGTRDGKGTVKLSAQVKKDEDAGVPKTRKDVDKLTFVCVPRPEGEACPAGTTTTTSPTSTSSTTTTSTAPTSTTSTSASTTSTSTTTTLVSTTSTTLGTTSTTTAVTTTTTTTLVTTTSTTVPSETTTSTTVATTTSSTTSLPNTTSTSTSTSTTTSTVIPALCGNGAIDPGETCDDDANSDNDACPANCFVAACTPLAGTVRQATVSFAPPAGLNVAGLTLLMNYPEEKVFMPPAGAQTTIGAANFVPLYPPAEVLIRGADLTHAVRGLVADSTTVPPDAIFQLKFQDCEGAAAPLAGEFNCTVLDATDPFTTPVVGVTCTVSLP